MAIKPIRSDQTVTMVWLGDPAIDWDATEAKHGVTDQVQLGRIIGLRMTDWREMLVFHPGKDPTEFVFGVIPESKLAAIEDDCQLGRSGFRPRSLYWRVFCAALRDIVNGQTERVKGKDGKWREEVPKSGDRVEEKWLEDQYSGRLAPCAQQLGYAAWIWQSLPEDDAKNSSGRSNQEEKSDTGAQHAQSVATASGV